MINICKSGDTRRHKFKVSNEHFPAFRESVVHEVCSTYVLAREIEWATRQFVLDMLEQDEEGIGTSIHIDHKSAAFEGEWVEIAAEVDSMKENHLICQFTARVGDRIVAEGSTGQKIYKKTKLAGIFSNLTDNEQGEGE